ncbi:MAG: sigma-54 dependent transcriptional regulator [Bacteroidales bacterium]|nr:sigma-54 dependent transcriptional regulator [Bacteroidales bacterium]
MGKVLIVDDENQLRALLSRIIGLEGYEVLQADSCRTGMKQLIQGDPDVVLCDVKLPDGNGVDLVTEIKKTKPLVEVILLTAHGNIPDGVQAIKNGAFDYITKGDDNNKIIPLLSRATEKVLAAKQLAASEGKSGQKYSFDTILGKSGLISGCIELARKVAATDVSVLLTGETGTGKEVFAEAIHRNSNRSRNSFVAVNCSAFSKELLESELFGHKAGAFTGALKDKKGLFEEADNGTLFLDEIGEMAFELQAKLLRILESGEFIKIGETKPTKVNVRIIAATNRDLQKEIETGNFREDLYYRLSVFQIHLPPLRERKEDIEIYARSFLKQLASKIGRTVTDISPEYIRALQNHQWRGNVRELRNVIERSMIIATSGTLMVNDLPIDFRQASVDSGGKRIYSDFELASIEKQHIQKVLQYTKGNKTEAARLMRIGLTTLYRKIEEYGIGY